MNPAFEATLGYSSAELLARQFADFIHPDDREAGVIELRRLAREGASISDYKIRYITKDRGIVWLSWSTITSGDKLYCVARDITAPLRAREIIDKQHEWFREMVARIPVPLYVVEAETGTMISMSAASMTMLDGLGGAGNHVRFLEGELVLLRRRRRAAAAGSMAEDARGARRGADHAAPYVWKTPDDTRHPDHLVSEHPGAARPPADGGRRACRT